MTRFYPEPLDRSLKIHANNRTATTTAAPWARRKPGTSPCPIPVNVLVRHSSPCSCFSCSKPRRIRSCRLEYSTRSFPRHALLPPRKSERFRACETFPRRFPADLRSSICPISHSSTTSRPGRSQQRRLSTRRRADLSALRLTPLEIPVAEPGPRDRLG